MDCRFRFPDRRGRKVSERQHMIEGNGLRFRTLAEGPATGELCILLHGFPEGAESWSRQVGALARAGALAVAPDMRGYGGSGAPAGGAPLGPPPPGWGGGGITQNLRPRAADHPRRHRGARGGPVVAAVHPGDVKTP